MPQLKHRAGRLEVRVGSWSFASRSRDHSRHRLTIRRRRFQGQTKAPAPSKPSAPVNVQTIATGLTGAWAVAFLPDGNFLVTQNIGTMRVVRPDGVVLGPVAGVPGVKAIGAQGLHDVVLDPDFARNRTLYFTYFAPPKGEAPGSWPVEFFYERVWTRPFTERRTMDLGTERVARARLSADNLRLENVEDLADGSERRIVIARDGTLLITGADRFRFYDSDLDGIENRDFTDNPDIRRNFTGRVLRINKDGSIPKDNPWLARATVPANTFAHGLEGSRGRHAEPADRRAVGDRSRAAGRRRDQHHPRGQGLRLAGGHLRDAVRRTAVGWAQERARRQGPHRACATSSSRSTSGCRRSRRPG